jgi:hypothetical protein
MLPLSEDLAIVVFIWSWEPPGVAAGSPGTSWAEEMKWIGLTDIEILPTYGYRGVVSVGADYVRV